MSRPWKISAVLFVMLFVASACGGSDPAPTQSSASPTSRSPLATEGPTVEPTTESTLVGIDPQQLVLTLADLESGWTEQTNEPGLSDDADPGIISWVVEFTNSRDGGSTDTIMNQVWVYETVEDAKAVFLSQREDTLNSPKRQQSYDSPFSVGTDSFYYREPSPNLGVVWFRSNNIVSMVSLESVSLFIKSESQDLAADSNRSIERGIP